MAASSRAAHNLHSCHSCLAVIPCNEPHTYPAVLPSPCIGPSITKRLVGPRELTLLCRHRWLPGIWLSNRGQPNFGRLGRYHSDCRRTSTSVVWLLGRRRNCCVSGYRTKWKQPECGQGHFTGVLPRWVLPSRSSPLKCWMPLSMIPSCHQLVDLFAYPL